MTVNFLGSMTYSTSGVKLDLVYTTRNIAIRLFLLKSECEGLQVDCHDIIVNCQRKKYRDRQRSSALERNARSFVLSSVSSTDTLGLHTHVDDKILTRIIDRFGNTWTAFDISCPWFDIFVLKRSGSYRGRSCCLKDE